MLAAHPFAHEGRTMPHSASTLFISEQELDTSDVNFTEFAQIEQCARAVKGKCFRKFVNFLSAEISAE